MASVECTNTGANVAPSTSYARGATPSRSPCELNRFATDVSPWESTKRNADEQQPDAAEKDYYPLSPGVRARREGFGLLFYNSRDAKLTFVKSGTLLDVSVDSKKNCRLTAICEATDKERTLRLLKALANKGLIDEP